MKGPTGFDGGSEWCSACRPVIESHTHHCADCQTPVDCDGPCPCDLNQVWCDACLRYASAVEDTELAALEDHDISRHERFQRGTPVGRTERKAFERDIYGDEG